MTDQQQHRCEYRAECHERLGITRPGYECGFEVAGTVPACPKRRRMRGEEQN